MLEILQFFKVWCEQKIALHFAPQVPMFKQGEVWWCCLGMNVGDEIYGKGEHFRRPVLVFKKLTRTTFLGLPLTTHEKIRLWRVEIKVLEERRWVLLDQTRVLDARRLQRRIAAASLEDLSKIRKSFLEFYGS